MSCGSWRYEPTAAGRDDTEGQQAFGCVSSELYFQNSPCFMASLSTEECNPMAGSDPMHQPIPEQQDDVLEDDHSG